MNLTTYKAKRLAAKKGYDLLKRKADALKVIFLLNHNKYCFIFLKVRFRDIMKAIYALKVGMADQSSTAFFSLTQAEYAAGNINKYSRSMSS